MSKRWLIALLLISVSFNLAVIGSVIYLRLTMPCPLPPRDDRRMPPPSHMKPFMDRDAEIMQLRDRFDDTKESLMQELSQDPVNEARVNAIIDSSLVAQNNLERRIGEKILAYRKTLSAEEAREHFLRRAERMRHGSRHYFPNQRHRR